MAESVDGAVRAWRARRAMLDALRPGMRVLLAGDDVARVLRVERRTDARGVAELLVRVDAGGALGPFWCQPEAILEVLP